jgi:aspartate ammonia-lyase
MAAKPNDTPLTNLAFFAGLPDTLVWHLSKIAEKRDYAKDDVLFKVGDERQIFGVILSGSLLIEGQHEGTKVKLATLSAGEVLGEGVLLEEGAHGTLARVVEPTTLVQFQKEPLMKLLKDQPALYAALVAKAARIINERIKRANTALLESARRSK